MLTAPLLELLLMAQRLSVLTDSVLGVCGWSVDEVWLCAVLLLLCAGVGASVLLADLVYDVPANVILDSARRALSGYDVITSCIKAWVFGLIISTVGGCDCSGQDRYRAQRS